jgi:formamidopyrimidine-DNA glycosylase
MPELPEVETVVRGLRAALPGRSIVSVRLGKTDFIEDPVALSELLPGRRVERVERVGKFIRLELSSSPAAKNPEARLNLIVHLGMTGRFGVHQPDQPVAPHTHGLFELDNGRELRYTDIRRFGQILIVPDSGIGAFRSRLGEEPLEIAADDFRRRLAGRCARIKALLLDQRVFRGIGNIYADESLWHARIHPARLAARLNSGELLRLRRAIRSVLRSAIRLRGSSISDYVDAEGNPGEYQRRHRVYGREGKSCSRCGSLIRRIKVAGRSSYFCPRCQRAPRAKR